MKLKFQPEFLTDIVSKNNRNLEWMMKLEETLTHRQLQSLIHISNVINSSFDIKTIIESIMSETISVVDAAEGGSFWLYDEDKDILEAKTAQGVFYPRIFEQIKLKPGESMTGKTFLARKSVSYPDEEEIKKALSTLTDQNGQLLKRSIPGNFIFSSVISSPILLKGKCIGVFTLDSFQQSLNFKPEDINLLEAICHQAAVALERSSLYKEKEATVKKLTYSIEAHRSLANLVLKGENLDSILQYIHGWIGENTFLFDDFGELISSSYDHSLSKELLDYVNRLANKLVSSGVKSLHVSKMKFLGIHYQIVGLSLGPKSNFLGLLIILSVKEIGEVDLAALEHASTVISLELVKDQAVFDTQQRYKGEFVSELLTGNIDETLINKAKSLNFNPSMNYIAVIINYQVISNDLYEPNDGMIRKIIHLANHIFIEKQAQGITALHENEVVILLSYHANSSSKAILLQLKEKANRMQEEVCYRNWNLETRFGIGSVQQGLFYVHKTLAEAGKCIKFIQRFDPEKKILAYSDLGIQRFILQNSEEEVFEFVQEVLGPLIQYENIRKGDLLKTLYVYLESNQNVKKTADILHVHINTLNYRLQRIEEILKLDLSNSRQLLNIHLALTIYEYKHKECHLLATQTKTVKS